MADEGLWGLFLLWARGETRSGCSGPDRSVTARHMNFYTHTQVCVCLAQVCWVMPSAVIKGLLTWITLSGGRFLLVASSLKHQMYCNTKPVGSGRSFSDLSSLWWGFPLLRLRRSARTRPEPFVCFSLGFYCCFYLFVPLPKHCLIPGSHAMFFFLFQAHKNFPQCILWSFLCVTVAILSE